MAGKLVRDKIVEKMIGEGKQPITHTASEQEYWQLLKQKLKEEAAEYTAMEKEEELADILEVIHAIAEFKKISFPELEKIRLKKKKDRGGFGKKIVWEGNKV